MKQKKNEIKIALFFLAPSVFGFLIFFFVPFILGLYYSMVDSPIRGKFVGLSNYYQLITNPVLLKACYNTFVFTSISVPLNIGISLTLAILLNKIKYFRNILRTAFVIPLVVPVASVVLVWQVIFDIHGPLNYLLHTMGFSNIDWMKTNWARIVVVVVYLWKNLGYNMILFLAGLNNIPPEYYESAEIDGAGTLRKFFSITMVCLTPTTFFVFIISIINSFKVFRETYLISGAYPQDGIYMLQHYMNNMFASLDYQKLTSAAFIMAIFIYLLVVVLYRLERKIHKVIN
ncbi:MAG: sugar ABC transporter permease [Clostridia bacterium]|nr:sugar ABC transporter permease [Clostridia bacterium]